VFIRFRFVGLRFFSVPKDGFVPVHVKLVKNRLNHTYC
jgi:hypothetical protein